MKNYSQYNEQEIILEFFKDKPVGRFLDIGANDGVSGSNTRALAELGWSGVLVEVNPRIFVKLLENCKKFPKLQCVNAAVMASGGLFEFSEIYDQCGTCVPRHQKNLPMLNKFFVSAIHPTLIVSNFGNDFDFISIDVEGADLSVLNSRSLLFGKASFLCIEDALPCAPFDQTYYDEMLASAATHGFTKVIHRTNNGNGNSLIAR